MRVVCGVKHGFPHGPHLARWACPSLILHDNNYVEVVRRKDGWFMQKFFTNNYMWLFFNMNIHQIMDIIIKDDSHAIKTKVLTLILT